MISLALWAPFAIVVVIAGLIFITNGCKKGLYTALLSFLATFLSAIASLPLANWLGKILGEELVSLLDLGAAARTFAPVIAGAVKGITAVVLFGVLFFFITMILKCLMQWTLGRLVEKKSSGMAVGGAVVRLVDTLIYTLLLLLPLYGTLGVYGPTAVMAVELVSTEGELGDGSGSMGTLYSVLKTVSEHPLVTLTTASPAVRVYEELSSFNMGDTKVSPVEMMKTATELSGKMKNLFAEDNPNVEEDLRELVDFMDEKVLDTDWCYSICMTTLEEVCNLLREEIIGDNAAPGSVDGESNRIFFEVMDSLEEMSRDEYKEIGNDGLAFMKTFLAALSEEGLTLNSDLDDEFFHRHGLFLAIGEVVNSTDRMAEIRTVVYGAYALHKYNGNGEAAKAFTETCENVATDRTDVWMADGMIIAHRFFISDECSGEELFRSHPYFGDAAYERAENAK